MGISNPCFEVWLFFHHFSDLPEGLERFSANDWKSHLNSAIPGGFDSCKSKSRAGRRKS